MERLKLCSLGYVLSTYQANRIEIMYGLATLFKLVLTAKEFESISVVSPIFFLTIITSCSSGKKAGLAQSSSAQSLELPVHTD